MTAATAGVSRVRQLADHALNLPEGILLTFTVEKFSSLAGAKAAAKSFQSNFSAMRAKARVKATNLSTREHTAPADVVGPYDALACQLAPLPNGEGFTIRLCPAAALSYAEDVRDFATGELLPEFDPIIKRLVAISGLWFRKAAEAKEKGKRFENPLSQEDIDFFFLHRPEDITHLYMRMGFPLPGQEVSTISAEKDDAFDKLRKGGGSMFVKRTPANG